MDNSELDSEWGSGTPVWIPLPVGMAECPQWWQNFASSLRYGGISEEQRVLDMENAMRENNLMWYYCDSYVRPSFSYGKALARGIVFKSETDFLVFRLRYS